MGSEAILLNAVRHRGSWWHGRALGMLCHAAGVQPLTLSLQSTLLLPEQSELRLLAKTDCALCPMREICISKSAWAFGIFSTWKPLCCKFQVLNFRCKFQCLFFKWSSFSWVPVGYGQFSWGVFLHVLLFFFPVTSLIFFTVLSCSHLHIFTLRLGVVLVFCLRVTYHTWFFSYQALHVEFIEVFL